MNLAQPAAASRQAGMPPSEYVWQTFSATHASLQFLVFFALSTPSYVHDPLRVVRPMPPRSHMSLTPRRGESTTHHGRSVSKSPSGSAMAGIVE